MNYLGCAIVLVLATLQLVHASSHQFPTDHLVLRGEYLDEQARNCEGDHCIVIPLSGPNVSIWHADGSCSVLFLVCNLEGLAVTLQSPGHVTESFLTWLGVPVADPFVARPLACSAHRTTSVSVSVGNTYLSSDYASTECGTRLEQDNMDETMSNTVNVFELLQNSKVRAPSVQLISQTHVEVQCCHNTKPTFVQCGCDPVYIPPCHEAGGCTEVNFQFVCEPVNSATESYKCSVSLKAGETLGDARLQYHLDSCTAKPANQIGSGNSVSLIAGSVGNAGLEVQVCRSGSGDAAVFEFQGPQFQFNSVAALAAPEQVNIICSISIALATESDPVISAC